MGRGGERRSAVRNLRFGEIKLLQESPLWAIHELPLQIYVSA